MFIEFYIDQEKSFVRFAKGRTGRGESGIFFLLHAAPNRSLILRKSFRGYRQAALPPTQGLRRGKLALPAKQTDPLPKIGPLLSGQD